MLDISLSTVKRVEKRMKNKESLKDRPRSSRPRAIDPAIVKTVFLKNPTMKMSELAKKKKISKSTFSRAVWSQSGKRLKKPLLTNGMIFKRKTQCKKLLNDIKSCGNRIIFFSDEKTFTVDPVINKQNDKVWFWDFLLFSKFGHFHCRIFQKNSFHDCRVNSSGSTRSWMIF